MLNVTLFSQIIHCLDRNIFSTTLAKYKTDKHNKGINSWTHFISMLFCHLSKSQSIREITNGLLSISGNLNHLGIQGKSPSKSSLSYINANRDWQMFREYYFKLLENFQNKGQFKRKKFKKIKRKIYLLDSTIISVCLKVFDWAKYRQEKGVIEIITNNFTWTASTISELYKQRWMIEIFFKELKQHLKIKSFIGTSENAMWIQIWTAMITLLLLRYLKEIAKYGWSLSNLIAFLRMNLFVKIDLTQWLDNPF